MKHRHASALLLGAIAAGASLLEAPDARSQVVTPACELTATAPNLTGTALNTAAVVKTGVTFTSPALVLSAGFTCGSAISLPVNLTPLSLATTPMVITAVRLRVDTTGDVRFSVSTADLPNNGPHEWVPTYDCDGGGPSTDRCARLPDAAGRSLRWKADMCNTAGAPSFRGIQPIFDYLPDNEIYHGGIAVNEGVSFFGGFSQPGDLGQLYAVNTDFDTNNYWKARDQLQSDTNRRIFTTSVDGTQRVDFTVANRSDPRLLAVLGVATDTLSEQVVRWVREQQRFGINAADGLKRRFGGVISSTPTVVTRPDFPVWFSRADADTRLRFQQFQDANSARPPMLLYGAKDGMVHALFADPRDITRPVMGTEAWALIPGPVASRMKSDFDMTTAHGKTVVTGFPDTSPVVDDVLLGAQFATIAVIDEGTGGRSISAIDITNTATGTPTSGYTVTGPTPLWNKTPGGVDAGRSLNRPAIARVRIGGTDRFMVIAGTGIAPDDPNHQKGRIVSAYDAENGNLYWQFQTRCSLTTAITVFDTDDVDEAGPAVAPLLDGYMDRAVFADRCGYVYKLNVTGELSGGWNRGIGGINVDVVAGVQLKALFQTASGLPITGNIAARALVDDDTTRVALFFGTGGLENLAPFPQNTFYVIAAAPEDPADTDPANLVFGTIAGTCQTPIRCEKFYGGVRVNAEQVIFTRVLEPEIGNGTDCDPGRTTIEARSITGDVADTGFLQESPSFAPITVDGLITSPLTTRGNAIFFTDSRGRANRVGDPNAGNSATGTTDEGNAADPNAPMILLGWRQVY